MPAGGLPGEPVLNAAAAGRPAWRLFVDPPSSGAWNMAMDEALLESVQRGASPVLRLYRWRPSCVSFGRNQPACDVFDPALARARGIDLVRRPTGGLAVHHARELTYAVASPVDAIGSPRTAYAAIHRALVAGLRTLGVHAVVAAASPATVPAAAVPGWDPAGRDPCFRAPARGEILLDGRKLVGSAQRCERRVVLQHGSILLEDDQDAVREIQFAPPAPTGAPATLVAALGAVPAVAALVEAIAGGFEAALGISLAPAPSDAHEYGRAAALEPKYRSGEWTWRR